MTKQGDVGNVSPPIPKDTDLRSQIEGLVIKYPIFIGDSPFDARGKKAGEIFSGGVINQIMQLIQERDTKLKEALLGARLEEAKLAEKAAAEQFEKLCRRVETDPSFGNSSKGKKHNFLDGAESMILLPSIRRAELEKEIKNG